MTLEWVNIEESYANEDIEFLYENIKRDLYELEDIYCGAYEAEPIEESDIKNAKKLVRNVLSKLNDGINIINSTINEYYKILNVQMELMDIDEYHDLRLLIKTTEQYTKKDLEEYEINKKIELLISLERNITKNRNPEDICKIINNIGDIRIDYIHLIEPERFILPAEYID